MKITKSMIIKESDEARELFLYADNNSRIYNTVKAVARTLAKHKQRGNYDSVKAIYAIYNSVIREAVKLYGVDFGFTGFTVTEKWTAAASMLESMDDIINESIH